MKLLTCSLILFILASSYRIDFGSQDDQIRWRVVNDGVMGGLSTGSVTYYETSMAFSGRVSLENNGGFASIRSSYRERDLSTYTQVKIRYRSKDYDFGLSLNKDRRFWIPNYKQNLSQTNWEWETVQFDLLDFKEYYIGRPTGNKISKKELAQIIQIGFISNEKRAGDFNIEIDYIEFI